MSKYKYEFYVCVGRERRTMTVDLVDNWGWDESDLDGRTGEDILCDLEGLDLERFVWNNVDCGVKRIDG